MLSINKLRKLSFLVYGLGSTGKSVVNFFKRNDIKKFEVWDDKNKNLYKKNRTQNLNKAVEIVDFIILSPGISLKNIKGKNNLEKFEEKIITDIDLIFLMKNFFKSIVVTGTNGKSTTSKIICHVLQKNGYKTLLGGNIGKPVLSLKSKKNDFLIIEVSSFQLSHSKYICPDYAILLNISNDHLDWHGNKKNYKNSKFKIFKNQKKNQFSLIGNNFKTEFKKRNLKGKLIIPQLENYKKLKLKIQNPYLKLDINDENMSYVFELVKLFGLGEKNFLNSLISFKGLPHRYEIFLKKKNCTFINDSKATSFQASKGALRNSNNIFWILGGLPKKRDKINLKDFKSNIVKIYLIGKNIKYFKKQIGNKVDYYPSKNLKKSLIQIMKDVKIFKKKNSTILLSPSSASYDQFLNFEKRGEEFKRLCKIYARKYI